MVTAKTYSGGLVLFGRCQNCCCLMEPLILQLVGKATLPFMLWLRHTHMHLATHCVGMVNWWAVGGQGVVRVSEQDKVMACPPILVTVKEGGAGTRVAKECRMQWGLQHSMGARSVRGRTTSNASDSGGFGTCQTRPSHHCKFWQSP